MIRYVMRKSVMKAKHSIVRCSLRKCWLVSYYVEWGTVSFGNNIIENKFLLTVLDHPCFNTT